MTRACARAWRGALGMGLVVALAVPKLAAAHIGCCVQCVNPHGETIPSAGWLEACSQGTLHSDKAVNAGENPDGFFLVGTRLAGGSACTAGTADVVLKNCTEVVFNQSTSQFECATVDGTFTNPDTGTTTFSNGTTIKYTQAPGAGSPTASEMGSNNGSGNPNGGAVEFRLKASGDLLVCSADGAGCELCLVPPPPK